MSSEEINQNSPDKNEDSQRKLNVTAKPFVPKLDETPVPASPQPQLRTPSKAANPQQGGSGANTGGKGSPGKRQNLPPQLNTQLQMPHPHMIPGLNPNMVGMPGMLPFGASPMVPGSPLVMNPAAAAAAAAAMRGAAPMMPGMMPPVIPPSPNAMGAVPMFMQPQASPLSVNVGNASLNAIKNQTPPKFACILLVGTPGVGKTTVGRQLVQGLNDDDLGWAFFSGSDHIQTGTKKLPHETLKDVYDALDGRLDECLVRQKSNPIRGLIIDKNCRGVEEVFYLSSLLHSKSLSLTAIINLDVQDDNILLQRLSVGEEYKEKIKHHRVILARIQESTKPVGLWKFVDASADKLTVAQTVRTMALGCSAQPPYKQLHPGAYSDSSNPLVADYKTYANVLTTLFSLVKTAKPGQFPLNTSYTPLKESHVLGRKALIRDNYMVRRKVDGHRYVLLFDGSGLYLIPRHMRAILQMPKDAWLGIPLSNAGKFVLDGDLVRLSKERQKEKFVVSDALFWGDKESGTNTLARAGWGERQERLKVNLCNETTAFFPKKGDCVVVHQVSEPLRNTLTLLDVCDYGSDGLIFVPHQPRDPIIVWRVPESLTCDFRLGPVTQIETTKRYPLEVFDQRVAKFVQYGTDVVEITNNRISLVEGAIVCCGLDTQHHGGKHTWFYQRTRSDVPIPSMKGAVDELLADCIIPKGQLLKILAQEKLVDLTTAAPAAPPQQAAPQQSTGGPTQGNSAVSNATRVAFGSALDESPDGKPLKKEGSKSEHADPAQEPSLLQRLKAVNPSVKVKIEGKQQPSQNGETPTPGNAVAVLENMLSANVVHKKNSQGKDTPNAEEKPNSRKNSRATAPASKDDKKNPRANQNKDKDGKPAAKNDTKRKSDAKPTESKKNADGKKEAPKKDGDKDKKPQEEKKPKQPQQKKDDAKPTEPKKDAPKKESKPADSDSGSESDGPANGDKPKRRRRGARGGANRASKRKNNDVEGGAKPAEAPKTSA